MDAMTFRYVLSGDGWSTASVAVGLQRGDITASYTCDALGDLVRGVAAIAEGRDAARVIWDAERMQYEWAFSRHSGMVWVSIEQTQLIRSGRAISPILAGVASVGVLCTSVAEEAQRILVTYGLAGYRTLWPAHDFPLEPLRNLQSLMTEV